MSSIFIAQHEQHVAISPEWRFIVRHVCPSRNMSQQHILMKFQLCAWAPSSRRYTWYQAAVNFGAERFILLLHVPRYAQPPRLHSASTQPNKGVRKQVLSQESPVRCHLGLAQNDNCTKTTGTQHDPNESVDVLAVIRHARMLLQELLHLGAGICIQLLQQWAHQLLMLMDVFHHDSSPGQSNLFPPLWEFGWAPTPTTRLPCVL